MKIYIDYSDFSEIFSLAALFFVVYMLFYGKYIYSLFDPLLYYVNALAFSSVFIVNTLLISQPVFAFHFFWCNFFLFIGFFLVNYKFRSKKTRTISLPLSFPDYFNFKVVLYILLLLYIFSNIILFFTTGFALLSDNPSVAKITNVQDGYAIISQFSTGVSIFLIGGLIFNFLYKPNFTDTFLLLLVIILSSMSGTKSALLQVGVILGTIVNHSMFHYNSKIKSTIKILTPIVLVSMISIPFVVLSKDTGDSEATIINFVTRLLATADSTIYFYRPVNEQYFSQFRFWEYPSYFFNGILDFLRLKKGIPAHGDTMLRNVINNPNAIASGTNTPYYIEGQIYFGYYGAFMYSIILGGIFAYSRYYFFNKNYRSIFFFVFSACIINHLSTVIVEVTYAVFNIFLTCFFVLPVYFFVNFFTKNGLKIRLGNKRFVFNAMITKKDTKVSI